MDKGIRLQSYYALDHDYSAEQLYKEQLSVDWKPVQLFEYTAWVSKVWQKVVIENTADEPLPLVLVIDRAFTVPTTVYFPVGGEIKESALSNYSDHYHVNFIYPSFYLELEPGKHEIYFHY